jgi:hypothetical protein
VFTVDLTRCSNVVQPKPVTYRERCVSLVPLVWPSSYLAESTVPLSYKDYHSEKSEIHVGLHIKCLSYLLDLKQSRRMSTNFSKNLVYEISPKFFLWESLHSVRTDGRTDMTNSITARCNHFPKAPTRGQAIARLTLMVAFLFVVSSVLPKLEGGEAKAGFR